ncbi:hypothetical protein [Persicitalea jodogahamensis]|uniref:hypothetical protein n=1 Tax=Persicitalea jodogahamensis TaxID=402147 RepID=UPI00167813F5|nr:hypothetical protein [Persicitalea jodogahamensis]
MAFPAKSGRGRVNEMIGGLFGLLGYFQPLIRGRREAQNYAIHSVVLRPAQRIGSFYGKAKY